MQLLNLDADVEVKLGNATIIMRPMNWGDRTKLLTLMAEIEPSEDSKFFTKLRVLKPEIDKILITYISKFTIGEKPYEFADITERFHFKDYIEIVAKLLEISGMREDESKN